MHNEREQLRDKIREVESFFKSVAQASGRQARELRGKAERAMREARHMREDVAFRARETARDVNDFAHEKPWKAIGIAAVVGAALGALAVRRLGRRD